MMRPSSEGLEELIQEVDCLEKNKENLDGVLFMAIHDLFEKMKSVKEKKFFIRCSYIEIYTDLVFDLLKDQE